MSDATTAFARFQGHMHADLAIAEHRWLTAQLHGHDAIAEHLYREVRYARLGITTRRDRARRLADRATGDTT